MANKPIQMSKLRQVLKLHCQGQSKLHISKSTGLSRNTVKKYLNILAGLKTTWEEVSRLSDKDLDELFCKEPEEIADERGWLRFISFLKKMRSVCSNAA
jgi:hypothetical protein